MEGSESCTLLQISQEIVLSVELTEVALEVLENNSSV